MWTLRVLERIKRALQTEQLYGLFRVSKQLVLPFATVDSIVIDQVAYGRECFATG